MANGIDTPFVNKAADLANELRGAGIGAVGGYLYRGKSFKDLLTKPAAAKLTAAGIYVVTIWESGSPTSANYFMINGGGIDGSNAAALALAAGQPSATPIYATVDYDAAESDLPYIESYFRNFLYMTGKDGYHGGVYGSGLVCQYLTQKQLVSHTMLSGSTGWAGYESWKPSANIVQGPSDVTVLGVACDKFTTQGNGGGWLVPAS